ncbi:sulfurtransferase complex subunit TusB [Sansalvadorimonas verongulae]|uniref:sulfurtransferase complex subunit TusB n=1 Tax=Sansalvadorimonas verongulae TaxID=2172824 RepID=UPI0012BC484F|nr:sulfurtransferase complex subunit TusB [Sansalvadorimonas verongulae]MTI12341.1 sulfurtransferase complex subunit TusB [Sansalvadorimonas verongulae]
MAYLHTINKSPEHPALTQATVALNTGDTLLFIEDGVNALIAGSLNAKAVKDIADTYPVYCLKADVQARGLMNRLPNWVTVVDFDGFVALTEQHTKTLSWF